MSEARAEETGGGTPGALRTNRGFWSGLLALAGAGICLVLFGTGWGLGVDSASFRMIESVHWFQQGQGFSVRLPDGSIGPIVRYLPLYPFVLAVIGWWTGEALNGARWLGALVFAANIVLIGRIVYAATGRKTWLALAGALLALWSVDLLTAHSFSWPEPLLLLLGLGGLLALANYLESPSAGRIWAAAALLALALLTSYGALGFWVAALVSMALPLRRAEERRERARIPLEREIGIIVSAAIPLAVWLVKNHFVNGMWSIYKFKFEGPGAWSTASALDSMSTWVLPEAFSATVRLLAVLGCAGIAAGLTLIALRRDPGRYAGRPRGYSIAETLPRILIFAAIAHLTLIACAARVVQPPPRFGDRTFLPVFATGLILALSWVGWIWDQFRAGRFVRYALALGLILFSLSYVARAGRMSWRSAMEGRQFASRIWRESELVHAIRALPESQPLFTNSEGLLYIAARRESEVLDEFIDADVRSQYSLEVIAEKLEEELRRRGGYYVEFANGPAVQYQLPTAAELQEFIPLRAVRKTKHGGIYELEG